MATLAGERPGLRRPCAVGRPSRLLCGFGQGMTEAMKTGHQRANVPRRAGGGRITPVMANGGGGLWDRAAVGEWTARSPTHLYALFLRHQTEGGLLAGRHGRRRTEAYAKLLMHLVAMQFNRHKWRRRLPQAGLVPEDVAQQAVMHLVRKSATLVMHNAGYKPLLGVLNVSIRMYVLQCVEGRRRKGGREVTATDYYGRPAQAGRAVGGQAAEPAVAGPEAEASDAVESADHLSHVRHSLLGEDAADAVVGDIVTRSAAEAAALDAAFTLMRNRLLDGRGIPSHARLPREVRSEVGLELHCYVAARLARYVRRLAVADRG